MECQPRDRPVISGCLCILLIIALGLVIPVFYAFAAGPISLDAIMTLSCPKLRLYLLVFLALVAFFLVVLAIVLLVVIFFFSWIRQLTLLTQQRALLGLSVYFFFFFVWNVTGTIWIIRYHGCADAEKSKAIIQLTEAVLVISHILVDFPLVCILVEIFRTYSQHDADTDIGEVV